MAHTQGSTTRDIIRNTLKKCNTERKDTSRKSTLELIARGDNMSTVQMSKIC